MRLLYLPAQAQIGDWIECQAGDWSSLGQFNVLSLCVQGVIYEGPDFYAVDVLPDSSVQVAVWHSDIADWPVGQRWARVVRHRPLAPDLRPEYGGAINTYITQTIYAEAVIRPRLEAAYAGNDRISFQDWTDFDPKAPTFPRKGIWVPDGLMEAQQAARSIRGWREWTEHLDATEVGHNGNLLSQRARGRWVLPTGTRTYYHRDTDRATGVHTAVSENAFETSTGSANTESYSNLTAGEVLWTATTPSGEPASAAWPTTGTYRYQIDATAVSADMSFGLLTQDSAAGHFARVSSDLATELQTFEQSESAFTASGLHLASITDPAWSSGSSTDRFEIAIAGYRTAGHSKQSITLQLNETDDYADGPWPAASPVVYNSVFFGCNT